jgi:hypothetical protein
MALYVWSSKQGLTDMNATIIRIEEQRLTDGSTVYNVVADEVSFACANEAEAIELAEAMVRLSLNACFDDWDRLQRSA